MRIGDVAARSGVSAKALRYYEEIGLVTPRDRTSSGYRLYDDAVLDRLAFIRACQALGFSLGEIRSIVRGDAPCGHVLGLLSARADDIGRTIRELRELEAELRRLVDRAEHLDPAACAPKRVCHLIG
jgi:DNA-binding transcriptional MerR regulator